MPYHQSQGMPGIMGRDVIITKIFFLPTSFVYDKLSIDPSWPGFLCTLTVKTQASPAHDYWWYFWKTSMHLIFHLLRILALKKTPSLRLSVPHNSNFFFSQSHMMSLACEGLCAILRCSFCNLYEVLSRAQQMKTPSREAET